MDTTRRQLLKGMGAMAMGLAASCATGHAGRRIVPRRSLAPIPPVDAAMDAEALDQAAAFVEGEIAGGQFPGAALVATRDGRTVLSRYAGTYCGPDNPAIPCRPGVLYILYSFSKAVTATVVAIAWQRGLVDLDAPVRAYIPAFTGGGKDGITLRHLLTHSAGLPSLNTAPAYTDEQWQAAVDLACAAEVEWEPGSRTFYHATSGSFIAAEVVRRVAGYRPWDDLCREWLFEPLGATGFSFRAPAAEATVALTPIPEAGPTAMDIEQFPFLGHPAGGCLGMPEDMLRLLNMHLDGGVWQGRTILQPDIHREMHTLQYADAIAAARAEGTAPRHEPWGLGWLLRDDAEPAWFGLGSVTSPQTFGHAGINTVIGVADPERRVALAFLTTDAPKSDADTIRIRNGVTDRVVGACRDVAGDRGPGEPA